MMLDDRDHRDFAAVQRAMRRLSRRQGLLSPRSGFANRFGGPMPRGQVIVLLAVLAWPAALIVVVAAWQMLAVLS